MKSLLLITLLAVAVTASLDANEEPAPMVPAMLDELENGYELDEDGIPVEIVRESRGPLSLGTLDANEEPAPMVPAMLDELENGYELDEDGIPVEIVPESRGSLSLGTITSDDRLVARINHQVAASSFVLHDQDVTFRGAQYTNISAIRVSRNGATQNAVPSIRAGGLRHEYVTIRIRGVRNRGFDYTINIYATINAANS